MAQLMTFLLHHWVLTTILIVILILIIFEETRGKVRGVHRISPAELTTLINRQQGIVFDVRDRSAYESGHIVGAVHLLPSEVDIQLNKIAKYKDKPVIVVCNAGQTALTVAAKLHKAGFEKMYSLSGGITAWKSAGLPLVKA